MQPHLNLPEDHPMARKYSMRCTIARTLDIIGDRWTILILRDLFLHPTRRFQDFEASLPGLTPSVLSSRIKELTAYGILSSRLYADHPPQGPRPQSDLDRHEDLGRAICSLSARRRKPRKRSQTLGS
jgi:DNA-binding HxlR family transcriptional regulator